MEPPPTQTIARFPSNVFSASKAPFPWYKSLGNVNLAIVQNPFLVLLLIRRLRQIRSADFSVFPLSV